MYEYSNVAWSWLSCWFNYMVTSMNNSPNCSWGSFHLISPHIWALGGSNFVWLRAHRICVDISSNIGHSAQWEKPFLTQISMIYYWPINIHFHYNCLCREQSEEFNSCYFVLIFQLVFCLAYIFIWFSWEISRWVLLKWETFAHSQKQIIHEICIEIDN